MSTHHRSDLASTPGLGGGVGGDAELDDAEPAGPLILSLHFERGMLGFAYFDAHGDGTLWVGSRDDCDPAPFHDRADALAAQLAPAVAILSSRAPDSLRDVLAGTVAPVSRAPPVVDLRPAADFAPGPARTRLLATVSAVDQRLRSRAFDDLASSSAAEPERPPTRRGRTGLPPAPPSRVLADPLEQAHVYLTALVGGDTTSNALSLIAAGALCTYLEALEDLQDPAVSGLGVSSVAAGGGAMADDPYLDPFLASMSVVSAAGGHPRGDGPRVVDPRHAPRTSRFRVTSVAAWTPADSLELGAAAMDALELFEPALGDPAATSLAASCTSLFELLNHTKMGDGKWQLRRWLARPLADPAAIAHRHAAVATLLFPSNAAGVRLIRAQLLHVRSVPRIFARPVFLPGDWRALVGSAGAMVKLLDALAGFEHAPGDVPSPHLTCFAGVQADESRAAAMRAVALIEGVIDLAATKAEARAVVRRGFDAVLDEFKDQFDSLPEFLTGVAESFATTVPPAVAAHVNVVYIPQIGFLTLLPRAVLDRFLGAPLAPGHDGDEAGDPSLVGGGASLATYAVPNLELLFYTPSYGYFKSAAMRELDESVGDVFGHIVDRELEIVVELRALLQDLQPALVRLHRQLVTLDVLQSLAEAAARYDYVRPELVPGSQLAVRGARHPIVERVQRGAAGSFIVNDIELGGGFGADRVALLTGPNAAGKSVYLKSAALAVIMAQMGSYVAAAPGSRLPVVDKILTRVSARESVSKGQSAFLLDLHQMSHATRRATPSSLVLIDEFGKGTRVPDGVGLFVGVMRYFAELGPDAPLVLAVTHFHEIDTHNLLPSPPLALTRLTMQVHQHHHPREGAAHASSSSVVMLYCVVRGTCATSLAAECALAAGVPKAIVARAVEASACFARGEPVPALVRDRDEDDPLYAERAAAVERVIAHQLLPLADPGHVAGAFEIAALIENLDECVYGDPRRVPAEFVEEGEGEESRFEVRSSPEITVVSEVPAPVVSQRPSTAGTIMTISLLDDDSD
ncbi:hypothetical protein H9P43_000839 [Blastocladiella emersonii ATCC 22665]|nr:hypothetical protein H9P43_000839 [Blastocladiella emersonii ATCC 22665]